MKITWYILVLLVFMVGIILIIYKILEDHRRVQRWQRKYWEVTPGHMAFPRETRTNTCSPQIFFLVLLATYCLPPMCKCSTVHGPFSYMDRQTVKRKGRVKGGVVQMVAGRA